MITFVKSWPSEIKETSSFFSPFYAPLDYPSFIGKRFSMNGGRINHLLQEAEIESELTDSLIKSMLCSRAKKPLPPICRP